MARDKNQPNPPDVAKPPADPSADLVPPATQAKAEMRVYRANWKLDGLPSGNLEAGETVDLAEEVAAPLVECGVLSEVEEG